MSRFSTLTQSFFQSRVRPLHLIVANGAFVTLCTLLGFAGRWNWFFDLFSHFRIQYFLILLATIVLLSLFRMFQAALIFIVPATLNLLLLAPLYWPPPPTPTLDPASHLSAILINVNTREGDPVRVAQFLQEQNPDLIVLEEINDRWVDALAKLRSHYAYSKIEPRLDNFGVAVLSKFPLSPGEVIFLTDYAVPTILTDVTTPQGTFSLMATHPLPPAGSDYSQARNEQLQELPEYIKAAHFPVLLLGDLNVTVWSHHFQDLLTQTGLRDSGRGRGLQTSWPTNAIILRIPIDHCLHSPQIEILRREIGPDVGSDHFPLMVHFRLPAP
jgi:endonuclease/exonuclease/phosphatase (EEP) superfamily protein YafD